MRTRTKKPIANRKLFSWLNNPIGRPACCTTASGDRPNSSSLRSSVLETRNRFVMAHLKSVTLLSSSPTSMPRTHLLYCLSNTTTLFTLRPSSSVPLSVHVRVFPFVETVQVMIIVTWPSFF